MTVGPNLFHVCTQLVNNTSVSNPAQFLGKFIFLGDTESPSYGMCWATVGLVLFQDNMTSVNIWSVNLFLVKHNVPGRKLIKMARV